MKECQDHYRESGEEAKKWMMKFLDIIFVAGAEGMGKNGVIISFPGITECARFVREQVQRWRMNIQDYATMLVGLKGVVLKPLSLGYLAKKELSEGWRYFLISVNHA